MSLISKSAQKHVQLGILFVLVYDILSSLKAVYLGSLFQNFSPVVMAVYTFALVAAFFWVASLTTNHQSVPSNWPAQFKNLIALNFSTTFSWLGFFFSLKFLEPSIASALTLAIGPSFSILFGRYLRPRSPIAFLEKFAAVGLFICVILMAYMSWVGDSASGKLSHHDVSLGFLCTMICGFGVVGNTYFSKRLNEAQWSPTQIMAQRFYLLLAVGILLWPEGHAWLPDRILFGKVAAITFAGLIIPLYCLQLGIKKCEPITVSLILALAPFLTLLVQAFDKRLLLSIPSLTFTLVVIVFTVIGIIPRVRTRSA